MTDIPGRNYLADNKHSRKSEFCAIESFLIYLRVIRRLMIFMKTKIIKRGQHEGVYMWTKQTKSDWRLKTTEG
jgi:hypothetical protein